MSRIGMFANNKGGVTKTTSNANVGAALAKSGRRTLLVDWDPQADLTKCFGASRDKGVYEVVGGNLDAREAIVEIRKNLSIMPATKHLAGLEVELSNKKVGRELFLKRALAKVAHDFDYILIDCAPSLGLLTINAMAASDRLLMPVTPCKASIDKIEVIIAIAAEVRDSLNVAIEPGCVFITKCDRRRVIDRKLCDHVRKKYSGKVKVLKTEIPQIVSLHEVMSTGSGDIFTYDPSSRGCDAYASLAKEIDKLEWGK